MSDIEKRLIRVVAEHLGRDKTSINSATRFVEDLGIDDGNVYGLLLEVEDEFDLDIPDEDLGELITIKAAADYIEERID